MGERMGGADHTPFARKKTTVFSESKVSVFVLFSVYFLLELSRLSILLLLFITIKKGSLRTILSVCPKQQLALSLFT